MIQLTRPTTRGPVVCAMFIGFNMPDICCVSEVFIEADPANNASANCLNTEHKCDSGCMKQCYPKACQHLLMTANVCALRSSPLRPLDMYYRNVDDGSIASNARFHKAQACCNGSQMGIGPVSHFRGITRCRRFEYSQFT